MRGAPHSGLARLICRMRSRTSFDTAGRPVLRLRDFRVQNSRKPLRDHPTTVSGLTMMSAFLHPDHSLAKQTQKTRSEGRR